MAKTVFFVLNRWILKINDYLCSNIMLVHVCLTKAYGHSKTEKGRVLQWCSPVFIDDILR